MISLAEALEGVFERCGYDHLWWGLRVLEAWPHAVGTRFAEVSRPILEKSPLLENGHLTVAVKTSVWMQELSFVDIAARLNHELGQSLVRTVRFDVRNEFP
jgi:hypothetical protein